MIGYPVSIITVWAFRLGLQRPYIWFIQTLRVPTWGSAKDGQESQ
jgi:hypothetical protein